MSGSQMLFTGPFSTELHSRQPAEQEGAFLQRLQRPRYNILSSHPAPTELRRRKDAISATVQRK